MEYTDILIDIRKIVRSINLESKQLQKEFGLSIPQMLTLTFLDQQEDRQSSQLELRKYLQLNSSTVTGIVSRLEKKGYLNKIPSPKDKRSTWLRLSEEGRQLIRKAPTLLHDKLKSRLQRLSQKESTTIQAGLHLLVQVLEVQDVEVEPLLSVPDESAGKQ